MVRWDKKLKWKKENPLNSALCLWRKDGLLCNEIKQCIVHGCSKFLNYTVDILKHCHMCPVSKSKIWCYFIWHIYVLFATLLWNLLRHEWFKLALFNWILISVRWYPIHTSLLVVDAINIKILIFQRWINMILILISVRRYSTHTSLLVVND